MQNRSFYVSSYEHFADNCFSVALCAPLDFLCVKEKKMKNLHRDPQRRHRVTQRARRHLFHNSQKIF